MSITDVQRLPSAGPDWVVDSRRALAIKGETESFARAMVDCYRRLAERMPDNGLQVVMFTHQDAAVWADLAPIIWAAGLRVTAAWCISTETGGALKKGNYVQGTVLLVLRKQTGAESAFLDEVYQEVEAEVRRLQDRRNRKPTRRHHLADHRGQGLQVQPSARHRDSGIPGRAPAERLVAALAQRRRSRRHPRRGPAQSAG